jgi:hypothetical protein
MAIWLFVGTPRRILLPRISSMKEAGRVDSLLLGLCMFNIIWYVAFEPCHSRCQYWITENDQSNSKSNYFVDYVVVYEEGCQE